MELDLLTSPCGGLSALSLGVKGVRLCRGLGLRALLEGIGDNLRGLSSTSLIVLTRSYCSLVT